MPTHNFLLLTLLNFKLVSKIDIKNDFYIVSNRKNTQEKIYNSRVCKWSFKMVIYTAFRMQIGQIYLQIYK